MRKLTNEEIKCIELNILKEFVKCCEEYGLRYYLCGGTLLGAIRHKGFIPWDDDIDICMPREDYEIFTNIFRDNDIFLLRSNCRNNFIGGLSQLVDRTTIVDYKYKSDNCYINLWIDIFPIDGLPEDICEVEKIYKKCYFYRTIYQLVDCKLGEGSTVFKKYIKYILKPLARIVGKKRCIDKIEEIINLHPYSESMYVGCVSNGIYGVGERMLKSEFEKSVNVEFEGYIFKTFSCWDSYLKGIYGDYMKLPPIEKRKIHIMSAYKITGNEGL